MSTAITGARVFDGQGLTEPRTVVVDDDRISERTSADGAEIVDGSGLTLLPGLIDTHAHVDKRSHLEAAAAWGVTTLLDMGNNDVSRVVAIKNLPGLPQLRMAGSPANAPDSIFVRKMGFSPATTVSGPEDAARFVADRVSEGADYVKILVEDPKIPGTKALSQQTVTALVAAAHAAGLMTIAHVVSIDTMRTALRAQVDVVTHAALSAELGAEFDELLAARPAVIVPTLTMMDGVARTIGGKLLMKVLSPVVPIARMNYKYAVATVATFRRAGMTVLVGTDSNDDLNAPYQVPHGASMHEEMARLVDAGLSPIETLQGATCRAAETFNLGDRGVIAPGRRADLLLVDGDPTVDIAATRSIRGVWIGGVRVR